MEKEIGRWATDEPEMEYQIADALRNKGHEIVLIGVHDDMDPMIRKLAETKPDIVFNSTEAFHGKAELDHVFPAVLEAEGHRYTGSGPLGLLITRNKAMSKKVLAYHGVKVPGFEVYKRGEKLKTAPELSFPLIVKPLQMDASVGIAQASVVFGFDELRDRVEFVHDKLEMPAIVEEFVDGRELYVGALGNGEDLCLLPVTEMVFDKTKMKPEERIATRSAKWDEGYRERWGIRNVFARPISKVARDKIELICRTAFRALELHDYGRLDVRLTDDDEVWVIEANANPFISYGHDMAMAAEKAGMDYYAFILKITEIALRRNAPAA
jgi:D-alanine-D-alanine ligase